MGNGFTERRVVQLRRLTDDDQKQENAYITDGSVDGFFSVNAYGV